MRHQFTIYRVTTDWITHQQSAAKVPGYTRQGPKGFARLVLDAERMHIETLDIYIHYEVRRNDWIECRSAYSTRPAITGYCATKG